MKTENFACDIFVLDEMDMRFRISGIMDIEINEQETLIISQNNRIKAIFPSGRWLHIGRVKQEFEETVSKFSLEILPL